MKRKYFQDAHEIGRNGRRMKNNNNENILEEESLKMAMLILNLSRSMIYQHISPHRLVQGFLENKLTRKCKYGTDL